MRWTEVPAAAWRTPQELVEEGFRRSRIVMLNEAHDGLTRCVRTSPGLEQQQAALVAELAPILDRYGGTAGLLREEAGSMSCWPGVDALIVSTDNSMT